MLGAQRAVRPQPASAPEYGPRRTGSSVSISSIARILGAPVIEPPGNDGREEVERVAPGRSRPVTVVTRCWTAAVRSRRRSRGTRTRARLADPPEVVAQHVDDHHVLGRSLAEARSSRARAPVARRGRGRGGGCP